MTKKMSRLDELNKAGIDYSIPIDRFAVNARALINKIAKSMKDPIRHGGGHYNDGGARIYVSHGISAKFLTAYDKAVRKLAREHAGMMKLKLKVTSVKAGGYEIFVSFN